MSAQEFKVGQSIGGTDYDRLPVGAKFRRGPQYSEYEVTETGFKLGMADTTLTAADYRSARRITHLPDASEPEDKDDLYVEPEPLKEGDWCLIWAQFDTVEPDDDGDVTVDVPGSGLGTQYVRADAVVRPSAGQVPPWLEAAEEPKGLGAVVEAEVLSLGRHDYVRTTTDTDFPWTRAGENYMANAYSWADLKNPKVIAPGWTESGGAS